MSSKRQIISTSRIVEKDGNEATSDVSAATPSRPAQITFLPDELLLQIFNFLEPAASVCIGLTNKHFYQIHRQLHGTVPLTATQSFHIKWLILGAMYSCRALRLGYFLMDWIPENLGFSDSRAKILPLERIVEQECYIDLENWRGYKIIKDNYRKDLMRQWQINRKCY